MFCKGTTSGGDLIMLLWDGDRKSVNKVFSVACSGMSRQGFFG